MLPEGEGFPCQCSSEVSQRIVVTSMWQTSTSQHRRPPSPSLPSAPHGSIVVKAEMHPVYAQLFPRKSLWDSNSPLMVAQITQESIFCPQNERTHKEAGHFGIIAWLSG